MTAVALIAVLLAMCGASFVHQARLKGPAQGAGLMLLGIFSWFLAVMFAMIALAKLAYADDLPTNPAVTQDNIKRTVCVPGWSASVRPPASVTNKIKRQEMEAAGIDWKHAAEIELDHTISIVLGGAPNDARNLRLQTWAPTAPEGWKVDSGARIKDVLEVRLHKLVCAGKITLAEAQACIYTDWRACAAAHPKGKP